MRQRPPNTPGGPDWEAIIQRTARAFPYPATPPLADRVRRQAGRRPAPRRATWRAVWVALAVLIALAALLAVPQVRAALRDVFRIGGIQIVRDEVAPRPLTLPGRTDLHLAGETSLAAARATVPFPIALPSHPADLGLPDRVFVQQVDAPLVILLWMEPDDPGQVRLGLHILSPAASGWKTGWPTVEPVTVNGQPALWVTGQHRLGYVDPSQPDSTPRPESTFLVEGHVLIWEQDGLTYRLESGLSAPEAIRIAESIE